MVVRADHGSDVYHYMPKALTKQKSPERNN